ncbi:polygalacturonase [Alteromonadaceae bacterium Bs31]|nr:polygalacturonase [Alteromonadaceae bacterium Bs31]
MRLIIGLCLLLPISAAVNAVQLVPEYEKLLPPEPSMPSKVCAELKAELVALNFRLPDAVDHDPKNSNPDGARIQKAINACPVGQAVKLVSNGKKNAFLSARIELKSGVTLWVDKGATLFASRSPVDFDLGDGVCGSALPKIKNRCHPWIHGKNLVNSGIVGEGVIDARGGSALTSGANAYKATWWDLSIQSKAKPKLEQNNPRMIEINGGENFTFYKITLTNATKFHVGTKDIDVLTFWGIKVITPSLAYSTPNYKCPKGTMPEPGNLSRPSSCFIPELVKNTDAIDPGRSRNVTLAYSYITTGDDNVAIKSGSGKLAEPDTQNHLYAHNYFYYGHGMSIGSETDAGVKNIKVWDLVLDGMDSGHGVGLRIKSDGKRGGDISDITYRDVCMRRAKDALVFSPYYSKTKETKHPPNIYDVTLKNVHYVDYPGAKYNKAKVTFSGYRNEKLVNPLIINFDNVQFDTEPELRDAFYHNVAFTFGPGTVKNIPSPVGDTIKIVDQQKGELAPFPCPEEIFKKLPSPLSPI